MLGSLCAIHKYERSVHVCISNNSEEQSQKQKPDAFNNEAKTKTEHRQQKSGQE